VNVSVVIKEQRLVQTGNKSRSVEYRYKGALI
jgi:hypothetical protein